MTGETQAHLDAARAMGQRHAYFPDMRPPDFLTEAEKEAWREGRRQVMDAWAEMMALGKAVLNRTPDGRARHIPLDELHPPVPPPPADRET